MIREIDIRASTPSICISRRWKEQLLFRSLQQPLHRVNVLGDDTNRHTGCVNALSWAQNGQLLISGGDDTTVRLWRMRNGDSAYDYPFACDALIYTGHRANIFNAQMLPNSSRIATVAGDKQVRISDIGASTFVPAHSGEIAYSSREANIHVLRCHNRRVKRIVTEESPDLFLTVAEDGTVRQHDLRAPHNCHSGSCPAPLVRMNHELNTIALSPLTPYQFVVAGESPYGYLFDRRHAGKSFQEQWGMAPDPDGVTTCVRRFGRATGEQGDYEHITGARMANSNGHEVLLSYSSDAVYLYSTLDNSQPAALSGKSSSILRNNDATGNDVFVTSDVEMRMEEDIERILSEDTDMTEDDARHWAGPDEEVEKEEQEEQAQYTESRFSSKAPIVLPRSRFAGACNVETVKDVNFLGPRDEFVVSGSDDGNFFIWDKVSGRLCDILEGDSSVVNVVEGHPHLPLVAVSGIDTTVKLFAPGQERSSFSRYHNAESIMEQNTNPAASHVDLARAFLQYQLARRVVGPSGDTPQCNFQ